MKRGPAPIGAGWALAVGFAASGCSNFPGRAAGDAGAKDTSSPPSDASESGKDSGPSHGPDSGRDGGTHAMDAGTVISCEGGPDGGTVVAPSCMASGAGLTECGACGDNCCASLEVPPGTYERTYANSGGGPTGEADPATVSGFRLDTYEVTVARFRRFVAAWNGGAGYTPAPGSGKHTHLNGGLGLSNGGSAGTYEPGWVASDDANIAPTGTNLACDTTFATWTTTAGSNENTPINCTNWYEAYAFCIWDGGFLPSESEWEYAAAGGTQQREYPWGTKDPGSANAYATYGCFYTRTTGSCTAVANIAPVGTAAFGAGLWGQLDLAGNVWEWNLDAYADGGDYVDPCSDCAYLTAASDRVIRGGDFCSDSSDLFPAYRHASAPTDRLYFTGFRCARTP